MGEDVQGLGSATSESAELRSRVETLESQVADLQRALGNVGLRRAVAAPPKVMTGTPEPVLLMEAKQPAPIPPSKSVGQAGSLESAFGAKVLSKVAVVLLLAGAAFFLKWAFDNRWIGPAGRVVIGLFAGAGVVLGSEKFRRDGVPAFSYALKAVGSGVLYLSLWASFQLYHLVPGPVAFAAMLGITAWNVAMSLTQDSPVLAGYALLGAYVTPALLSTGGDHEIFLLTYLALIAAGVLVLLRVRIWNVLLVGVLPVTTAYFIAWYAEYFRAEKEGVTIALSLLLWAVLAAVPVLAKKTDDALAGVLQPLGAGIFAALTIYSALVDSGHREAEAWVALGFGAIYLGLSRRQRGSVVAALHLSLSVTFLTVAIPLKATGHGITVGWLAEAMAVLWVAAIPAIDARARAALQWLGVAALLLGTGGALLGPAIFASARTPFWNRDFATSIGATVALIAAMLLVRRWPAHEGRGPSASGISAMSFLLLNVVLLFAMHREISLALQGGETSDFSFSAWMALQGAAMLALGFWQRVALARWLGLVLLGVTIVKTVTYDMRQLSAGYRVVSYLALGVLLMVVSYAYQKDWLGLQSVVAENDGPTEEAGS